MSGRSEDGQTPQQGLKSGKYSAIAKFLSSDIPDGTSSDDFIENEHVNNPSPEQHHTKPILKIPTSPLAFFNLKSSNNVPSHEKSSPNTQQSPTCVEGVTSHKSQTNTKPDHSNTTVLTSGTSSILSQTSQSVDHHHDHTDSTPSHTDCDGVDEGNENELGDIPHDTSPTHEGIGYGPNYVIPHPHLTEYTSNSTGLGLPYLTSSLDLVQLHQKYKDVSIQLRDVSKVVSALEYESMYNFQNIVNLAIGAKTWIDVLRKELYEIKGIMTKFQHFVVQSFYYFQTYTEEEIHAYYSHVDQFIKRLVEENAHLKEKYNKSQVKLSTMELAQSRLRQQCSDVLKSVKTVRSNNDSIKQYITTEHSYMHQQLAIVSQHTERIRSESQTSRSTCERLTTENRSLQDENKELLKQLKTLQQQLESQDKTHSESFNQLRTKYDALYEQSQSIGTLQSKLSSLEKENQLVKDSYDALKKRFLAATEYKDKTQKLQNDMFQSSHQPSPHIHPQPIDIISTIKSNNNHDMNIFHVNGSPPMGNRQIPQSSTDNTRGSGGGSRLPPLSSSSSSLPVVPRKTLDFSAIVERARLKTKGQNPPLSPSASTTISEEKQKPKIQLPSSDDAIGIMTPYQLALLERVKRKQSSQSSSSPVDSETRKANMANTTTKDSPNNTGSPADRLLKRPRAVKTETPKPLAKKPFHPVVKQEDDVD